MMSGSYLVCWPTEWGGVVLSRLRNVEVASAIGTERGLKPVFGKM